MTVKIESLEWKEWLSAGGGGERCPSTKSFLKAVRTGGRGRQGRRILDHVSRCGSCARDYRFILNVLEEEKKLLGELDLVFQAVEKTSPQKRTSSPSRPFAACFSAAAYSFSVLLLLLSLSLNSSLFADRAPSGLRGDASQMMEVFDIETLVNQYIMMAESQGDRIQYDCRIEGDSLVIRILNGRRGEPDILIIRLMQH